MKLKSVFDIITRGSLRFRWAIIALSVVLLASGVLALFQLNQELIPPVEFPQSVVLAFYQGAAPQQVLEEMTIPIEDAVRQVEGVVYVESNTGPGYSAVIISSEFGLDQDAVRDEIRQAVSELDYPEGVETPELLAFSLNDLPLARVSASSGQMTLTELKDLAESEIVPALEAVDGVAHVRVSGGQELPATEVAVAPTSTMEPSPTATLEPTATPTATPEPTPAPMSEPGATPTQGPTVPSTEPAAIAPAPEPVALPPTWVQGAAAQGMALETTADLTPQIVGAIASMSPQMLNELTPEMLLAMPLEALAALPEDYLGGLDGETQKALAKRQMAAKPEEKPGQETADGSPPLPASWIAMAEQSQTSMPIQFRTAADLLNNPFGMKVADLLSLLATNPAVPDPAALMGDLTPEIVGWWADQDPGFWAGLAPATAQLLSPQVQALIPPEVLAGSEAPPTEAPVDESPALPDSWLTLAEQSETPLPMEFNTAADLLNNPLGISVADLLNLVGSGTMPTGDPATLLGDLTPEIVGWWAEQDAGFWSGLTPETMKLLPPGVQALIPAEVLAQAEAAAVEDETAAEEAPPLPDSWTGADSPFQTTADLINNPFGLSAAQLLNLTVTNDPEALGDLTPEVIRWLGEQDETFLTGLEPATLRLLSPEVLAQLPPDLLETLDADLRAELEGIAAGTVTAFIPTETINRTDGQPSLLLTINKKSEANTVALSHAVFDRLDEMEASFEGLRFEVAFEQSSFIEESIAGVAREGSLGAIFAVLVILLFLSGFVNGRYVLSWRSTLVTAVSIPLSVMMGFALMRWLPPAGHALVAGLLPSLGDKALIGPVLGFLLKLFPASVTLNIMTLSGMTVAIGRVVDDSIVVLENIFRHIQRGEDPRQAVIDGTRDVAIPIFASTVTTVVVFLPIGLMGGLVGSFFLPFGMTVTYALGSSFLVAITIVPLLAYLFIRKEHLPATPEETGMQRVYAPALKWALRHRLVTLLIAAAVFAGSLWLLNQRPRTFLPDLGEPTIDVQVSLSNGTTMAETDALVKQMEEYLSQQEGIKVYQSEIGSSGGMETVMYSGGIDQRVAVISMSVVSLGDLDSLTREVRRRAEAVFGVDYVTVSAGGVGAAATGGFDLVVTGPPESLAQIDSQVFDALAAVDGLVNVSSNLTSGELIIRVNGQPAVRYEGEVETEDTMGVLAAGRAAVENLEGLPSAVSVSEGFFASMQTEGFRRAGQALIISIVVVYLVMIATFRSVAHPFVILFSLPLAAVGAALGLWITDKVVGISAMVGLMMLVGIVVTNAIVLIDRVNMNRKERGMAVHEALVEAGRTRLRPILMTAIAAILALVPLGLGLTEGALIASDLAVVVIGGLFTSTFLTLLVVPVVYSLVESALRRPRRSQ